MRLIAIAAAGLSAIHPHPTRAANQTWDGTGGTQEWNTAANWTADALPTASVATINTSTGLFPIISVNSTWKPTDVVIGSTTGQTGRLDHRAGSLELNVVGANGNWFFVGRSGGTGTYNLANTAATGGSLTGFGQGSGSLTVGKFFVGGGYYNAGGTGTVNINTTGTLNVQSTQNFTGQGASSLVVGFGAATGTLNVDSGTINAAGIVDIGAAQNNTQNVQATLRLGTGATLNSENDFRLAYAGNASSQATLNLTGGTLNVGSTVKRWFVAGTWDFANSTTTVSSGNINLNTNTDLKFKIQAGTGNHTVNLNGGAITSYSDNHVTATGAGVVDLMSVASTAVNTFNLNGGTLSIREVITSNDGGTAAFNFNGGTLKATGATTNFLILGGASQRANVRDGGAKVNSNGYNVTIAEALVHSNVGGDAATDGGLTKSGSGTLTLTGANTYTGATTINGGTLLVSANSVNTSSGVTINGSGAKYTYTSATAGTNTITVTQGTLDGTGTVGAVTVGAGTGGIVTNGNGSTTKLTMGSLTFSGGGTINLNLLGGGSNTTQGLDVTGALTTSNTAGSVVVNVIPTTPLTVGTSYNLVNYGSFSGSITDFVYGGNTARKTGTFADTGTILTLTVNGDTPKWTGDDSSAWVVGTTGASGNWKLVTAGTATDYIEADDVSFTDTATSKAVNISSANVSPGSTTFNNSTGNDYTVSSSGGYGIAGTGPLVKNGTGKVTFTTTNTYTAATSINGGTLELGDGTTDGSIANTSGVTNNATLAYNLAGSSSAGYAITGTGNVTKDGAGTVVLAGTNSYGGGTTLNAGTLSAGSTTAFGATASTLTINGGSLDSSVANLVLANNNAQAWNGDFGFTGTNSLNLGTGAVTLSANRQVTVSANTLTVGGAIGGGAFSLTKAGAGTLALTAANSYSGGTTINNGTLAIGGTAAANAGALGTGALTINAGSTLRTGYAVSSNTNNVTVANNITLAGGSIFADDGFQRLSGSLDVTAASTLGSTYNSGNAGAAERDKGLFLEGVVSGSANLTVQHSGITTGFAYTTSIVHFANAANTYSGTITVTPMAGSVTTSGGSYLGLSATNALQFATVNLNGNQAGSKFGTSPLVFKMGIAAANIGALGGSGNIVLTGYDEINHTYTGGENIALTVGGNNASTTLSGIISGGGSLTKTGTGALLLSGTNTFTGDLVISGGTVTAGTGQGSTPTASNLGALQPVANRNITVNNGGTLSLTGGNVLGTGASTNTLSNTTLVVNTGGVFQTGKDGAGAGWWNKVGAINLNGGTIRVGSGANDTNFQSLALIGTVTVGGSTASTIDTHTSADAAYTAIHLGQNAATGQSVTFDVADVTGDSAADLTVSAKLINTSANLVASGLTKAGSGTITLTAANGYTGNTVIKAGTLALSGSGGIASSAVITVGDAGSSGAVLDATAVSGVTIGSSQKLNGIGTVDVGTGNTLTIAGTHAPGNSVGTQSVTGDLTYASGAIFEWDLNANLDGDGLADGDDGTAGTDFDNVDVTGAVSASSGSIFKIVFGGGVDLANAFWSTNGITQTWNMSAIFGSSFTGSFTSVQSTADPITQGSFTIDGSELRWTAVPEPTSGLAGLLVGAGLLRRRRKS